MNKKYYKVISFVLSVVLLLSAAACGSRVEESEEWISGEDNTQTIKHSSGTKGSSGDGTLDSDGRTSVDRIQGGTSGGTDLKGATVTIGYYRAADGGHPTPGTSTYQDEMQLISDIEKKYNCKIQFKNVGDSMAYYRAWTSAAQAGTKFADIIQIATSVIYPTHMQAGYLAKLDDYLNLKDTIYNQKAMEQTKVNGSHYMTVMSNRIYVGMGMYFNKSVFNAFSIKTPDTYVSSNNWTWDKFLEIAKAMTGTKNGVQYYGFGMTAGIIPEFATSNGAASVIKKDNKYVFNMGSSQYIKGIQFCYDLYNTHGVSPDMSKSASLWNGGNVAMYVARADKGTEFMESLGSSNVGFTYIPKGPDVKDYNVSVTETTAWAIPATASNPKVMAQIMYDYTYPYKWRETLEQQQENHFGDSASLKTAMDIGVRGSNNISLIPMYSYISREVELSDYGILSKTSPQAYIASISAAAQAELDSVWGQ